MCHRFHRLAYYRTCLFVSRGRNLFYRSWQVRIVHNEVSRQRTFSFSAWGMPTSFVFLLKCREVVDIFVSGCLTYSNASPNFWQSCLCYLGNFTAPQELKGSAPQKLTMYLLFQFLHFVTGENDRIWKHGCATCSWQVMSLDARVSLLEEKIWWWDILVLCLSIL